MDYKLFYALKNSLTTLNETTDLNSKRIICLRFLSLINYGFFFIVK